MRRSLTAVAQDFRDGLRAMRRTPASTAVAVLTLAVGIGINATVFTVTNAVLFKGFAGVSRNDRLVYISNDGCCVSYPDFEDYRAQATSFQGMAIVHGVGFIYSDGNGLAQSVESNENSADVFRLVGAKPILGRDFEPADEVDGAPAVGILNYGFWERQYGKDPAVVGRIVRKNGAPMTIIGVMPEGFSFPQKVDVWVPLVKTAAVLDRVNRDTWCVVGRLADGATFDQARTEIDTIAKRLATQYPASNRDLRPMVGHFHEFFVGRHAALIYGSMWGAVGFVLLIACANLANLLLARAIDRSREISIRMALGAGRWRIIQQLLVESLTLSAAGGLLGWWLAKWGVTAYAAAMDAKSGWLIIDYTMDRRVIVYQIALSIGTGVLFGLAPALRLSKLDVHTSLKDGGRGATDGRHRRRLSALLVAAEMALALVLAAGAGVMIRSYLKVHTATMGVNLANIVGSSITLTPERYPRPQDRIAFFDQLTTRLQAMPGVELVAMADSLPSWGANRFPYELSGETPADELHRPMVAMMKISPAYFRTVRAGLVTGREFNDADNAASVPVAIVNRQLASHFWPGENPLGKRLRLIDRTVPGPWLTVVGVVTNIVQNDASRQRFDPIVYQPYRQKPGGGAWVLARTGGAASGLVAAFRREVQRIDPELALFGPMLVADRMERYWDSRFYGALFLIFAAIALLLASIGLYTVVAHSVGQRTQEIGVRMALGADARHILALVARQGLLPAALGLTTGLAAALALNRLLSSMLVQVSPNDPVSLIGAATALAVSAGLGCLIPARRALRVDPIVALRQD